MLADPHAARSPSADAYAVGAVAAACLLGEDPPTAQEELARRVRAACRRLRLPDTVAAQVLAPLAADPGQRPEDLVAWSRRLVREASRPRRRARLLVVVGAAAAAVAAATAGALLALDGRSSAAAPSGSIDTPADGSTVLDCSRFTGTASATGAGRALVLASRNLVNRDPIHYVEPVVDYDQPRPSDAWQGSFWFNEQSVGQSFEVSLVDVDLADLQASLAAKDPVADDAVVLDGTVLDSVVLTRGPGADGVTDCLLESAYTADDGG